MNPENSVSRTVEPRDTAAAWGPEFPPAASTPFILSLAELACHGVLAPDLADDELTVGAGVELSHDRPSPVGAHLTATAVLVERNGTKARFEVEVTDGSVVVARVQHRRAVLKRAVIEGALQA
ncbi:hotdog domain-containing protein [Aeromicrobium sp.]|jgi:fluoroacetyl-CoA thioesterase|uniref:thioesterase family protein n=1 Tax=Aeromicrobium sp. TaxID=1871063 RepID=UPI0025C5581A|nr:hotdog domain-containing protein [Aeromicrobium sp.]MCK5890331.1 thioesterase [Aeromicrobium sp.]